MVLLRRCQRVRWTAGGTDEFANQMQISLQSPVLQTQIHLVDEKKSLKSVARENSATSQAATLEHLANALPQQKRPTNASSTTEVVAQASVENIHMNVHADMEIVLKWSLEQTAVDKE